MSAGNAFCVPSLVHVPSMEVDLDLTDVQQINFCVNKLEQFSHTIDYHFKNRTFLKYDDDSSC